MVYGPAQVVSFDLDPAQVTAVLLEAGLAREEIWPLLSLTKTSLEKGLKKFKRQDLLDQILSDAPAKTTERIDFRKNKEVV